MLVLITTMQDKNIHSNRPNDQQSNYPYDNQDTRFSQSPIQYNNHSNSRQYLGTAIAVVSVLLVVTVLAIIGTLVYFGVSSQIEEQEAMRQDSLVSLDKVNETIAQKPYFDMRFPALTCGPSESGYTADKRKWMQDWMNCVDQQWAPVVKAHRPDGNNYTLAPLQFIQSKSDMGGCKSATSQLASAALYCREDSTIYVHERSLTNSLKDDLSTLFHEYSHHLQLNFMVNVDAELLTKMLYDEELTFPQPEKVALAQQNARIEINAECSTLGMMYSSGQLNDTVGQQWLRQFNTPSVERTKAGYGSANSMQKIKAVTTDASASMQTCNTWKWPVSDL